MHVRKLLIVVLERRLRHIGVIRRYGDQLLIVKGNPKMFRQAYPQFPAATAEFTAYCNHFVHNCLPPLLFVSISQYSTNGGDFLAFGGKMMGRLP